MIVVQVSADAVQQLLRGLAGGRVYVTRLTGVSGACGLISVVTGLTGFTGVRVQTRFAARQVESCGMNPISLQS